MLESTKFVVNSGTNPEDIKFEVVFDGFEVVSELSGSFSARPAVGSPGAKDCESGPFGVKDGEFGPPGAKDGDSGPFDEND